MYTHSAVGLCVTIDDNRLQSILVHLNCLLVCQLRFQLDVVQVVAKKNHDGNHHEHLEDVER